jgi:ABC-2 type transport system permease protein
MILHVCRSELSRLLRGRVAQIAFGLTLALALVSALSSVSQHREQAAFQARVQAKADQDFLEQPARHPHRVVHFGHFAARSASPLAAFDPGVETYTGNLVYLSPAFLLQTIAPLLLIFLGAGMIAGERERGLLRQSLAAGATPGAILAGKSLALGAVALGVALPGLLLLAILGRGVDSGLLALGFAGYAAYLLFWVALVVGVSALARRTRTALIVLVAAWAVMALLSPRAGAEVAASHPLTGRFETDIALQRDLRAMGDSHDPNDPYFAKFKAETLARYGVSRIEDLPVNYRGLLGIEGERMTSSLFNRYAAESFGVMTAQSARMDRLALISPTVALRRLSASVAGVDLAAYRRFLDQAEAYRYALIQKLNGLQATAINAADDAAKSNDAAAEARSRIAADNWKQMPMFRYEPTPSAEARARAWPAFMALAIWLAFALALVGVAATRLAGRP